MVHRHLIALLLLVAGSWLFAADPPMVARVEGEEITLRELEDELLRREGTELLQDLIERHLATVDWETLDDQDPILSLPGYTFRRVDLVSRLLERDGAKVRTELINIAVARSFLDRHGVVATDTVLEAEWDRMQRAFEQRLRNEGQPHVPFADYIRMERGMEKEAFMAEPGFVMAARLHQYVIDNAEIGVDELKEHYVRFPERFITPDAVKLSVITIPYKTVELEGKEVVDPRHYRELPKMMQGLREDIATGKRTFARAWKLFGKGWDPESEHGLVGWVPRSGRPDRSGARTLPAEVMDEAWAVDLDDGPVLLPVVRHPRGCDLVRVEARRAGQDPTFDEIVAAVRADYVEEHLERLTGQASNEMIRQTEIEFGELHQVIEARRQDRQRLGSGGSTGGAPVLKE